MERGSGGDLCAGEWLGFSSLSNAFVTFYFADRALDLGPLCAHSSTWHIRSLFYLV